MSSRLIDRVKGAQQRYRQTGTTDNVEFERIKKALHSELIESLDFEQVNKMPREELKRRLRKTLTDTVESRSLPLNRLERERLVDEILDEILGLGPLEPLLRDQEVSDILINGYQTIYVEKKGRLQRVESNFQDDNHLLQIIDRIVSAVGRRIDETNPMVDARLPDGSRFNAIIPPLALDGPAISIRRFGTVPITPEDLIAFGSVPRPMMDLLKGCVRAKLNVVISGGTGSGKTTLLNVLSSFIPDGERIVTIEDAAELQLQQSHVVRLETRPPNLEGKGEVTARDLVKNSLRMRPDRVILGEIRGGEAIDMLQAMNTGHEGSISTVHANSPRHALGRMQTMVGLGMGNIPGPAIREMIADALDLIIQVDRLQDGTRRITSLTEIVGIEGGVVSSQEIFRFKQRTIEPTGKVRGWFESTGVRPSFALKFEAFGLPVPAALFSYREEV